MERRKQLQIESAASRCRDELKIGNALKFDIIKALGKIGVRVEPRSLESNLSGFSIIEGDKKIIAYNEEHAEVRQRFTIAHELGHLALHAEQSLNVGSSKQFYRSNMSSLGIDPKEIEANYFAAYFLMPTNLLEKSLKDNGNFESIDEDVIADLAKRFNVSEAALTIRLSGLGYF